MPIQFVNIVCGRSYGGFLAQPDVYWKNNQLKQQLRQRSRGQDVWFGLNKMGNAWCHIDGSFVGYTDWGPGRSIFTFFRIFSYGNDIVVFNPKHDGG